MPGDDLTPVQRSVLLTLMAEAREVSNVYLTNDRKLRLEKPRRDDLERRGLIHVRLLNRRLQLELAEPGWRWCREQSGDEVPPNAGHGGAAAYAILAGVHRYLAGNPTLSLPEFFARMDDSLVEDDLEARIRKVYQELAPRPGNWVKLADLRFRLGGADRTEVDGALVAMNRTPEVNIVPESSQMTLTDRDRAAAVVIGNQDKHLIAIGP